MSARVERGARIGAIASAAQALHLAGVRGVVHTYDEFDLGEAIELVRYLSSTVGLSAGDKWLGFSGARSAITDSMIMTLHLPRSKEHAGLSLTVPLFDLSDTSLAQLNSVIRGQTCEECGEGLGWQQWELPHPEHEPRLCGRCFDRERGVREAEGAPDVTL